MKLSKALETQNIIDRRYRHLRSVLAVIILVISLLFAFLRNRFMGEQS